MNPLTKQTLKGNQAALAFRQTNSGSFTEGTSSRDSAFAQIDKRGLQLDEPSAPQRITTGEASSSLSITEREDGTSTRDSWIWRYGGKSPKHELKREYWCNMCSKRWALGKDGSCTGLRRHLLAKHQNKLSKEDQQALFRGPDDQATLSKNLSVVTYCFDFSQLTFYISFIKSQPTDTYTSPCQIRGTWPKCMVGARLWNRTRKNG